MRVTLDAGAKQARQGVILAAHKTDLVNQVNTRIGQIRKLYITDIPAQEMIYLRKETEARAYLLDVTPNLDFYPMLKAEIGVTAPTAYELAQIWLYMSDQWLMVAALLETIRLGYVYQIQAAPSKETCDQLLEAFYVTVIPFQSS